MKDSIVNELGGIFIFWIALNFFAGVSFLAEGFFDDKPCHKMVRIEYVIPAPQLTCRIGKVTQKALTWLFSN